MYRFVKIQFENFNILIILNYKRNSCGYTLIVIPPCFATA
jgi:hypothetical protein